VLGLLVAAVLGVAVALESPLAALASGPTVSITTHFDPSPVTITAGQTVTWVNKDTSPHWVIFERNTLPPSGSIKPGGTYRVVFRQVGTYPYQDEYGNRSGTVIVNAAPPPTPTPQPTAKPTPRPTPRPTVRPKATAKPIVKATPKPTKAPVVKATPTTAAVAAPTAEPSGPPAPGAGTTTEPAGSPEPGAGVPIGSTGDGSGGGLGGLGLITLLIALGGLAFEGGIWFARRGRPEPPVLLAEVAGVGAGAGSAAARASAATIATPPPPVGSTRHQMPGDVVEDEPLQSARVEPDPDAGDGI
jgi:plastocyanin